MANTCLIKTWCEKSNIYQKITGAFPNLCSFIVDNFW